MYSDRRQREFIDADADDATIRKLYGFGLRPAVSVWHVGNLLAYRSKDVGDLAIAAAPIGPDKDKHLARLVRASDVLIAGWGPAAKLPREHRERWREAVDLARTAGKPLQCWGAARDGQPRHPLMLAYATPWLNGRRRHEVRPLTGS